MVGNYNMEGIEYNIDFTDVTLNEADGVFKEVDKIMKQEPPYNKKWIIRSFVTITSLSGMGEMEIQCHGNKGVYILDYKPSIEQVFYNPDIQVLSMWAQENGWKIPQPHQSLVKNNKVFWKHFYDTLIIDSDYLDKRYGKRPQLIIEDKKKE